MVINRENYHIDTSRISKSGLDKINQTPLDYWYHYLNEEDRPKQKHTEATLLGDCLHVALFEPQDFFSKFITPPGKIDRRRKEGREQWAAFEFAAHDKTVIKREMYDRVMKMREAVLKDPLIGRFLKEPGTKEEIILWDDPGTGAPCKCRLDFRHLRTNLILDLKSAGDDGWTSAAPAVFARNAIKYRYHVQSAFYSDGFFHATGIKTPGFVFVVVENNPPYKVAKYRFAESDLNVGRSEYTENLYTYMHCKEVDFWPGYSDRIETLTIF
jgi:hypothetical protein